jgi:signal peptidase II
VAKLWAAAFLAENGTTVVHPWLTIRETYNRGVAFGLFQGIGPVVGWLTISVVIVMIYYLWRLPSRQWISRLGLALLIGGASGNLVDRVVAGQVLDFLDTVLRPGIFNVADVLINSGMILLLLALFLEKHEEEEEPLSEPVLVESDESAEYLR